MSLTAQHAQGTGLVVDGFDLSTILNEATVDHSKPPAVCTTFSSGGDHEYVAGIRDSMLSCKGVRKGDLPEWQSQMLQQFGAEVNPAKRPITYCPQGYGAGKQCEIGLVGQTMFDVTVPFEGVVSLSLTLQVNGGLRLATQLFSPVGP